MKKILLATALLAATSVAHAAIPLLNATCPSGIEVHADQGGPIYINGKEAKLKKFNDNSYEARGGGVTISLTIMPDGSPDVAYTGKGGPMASARSSRTRQRHPVPHRGVRALVRALRLS